MSFERLQWYRYMLIVLGPVTHTLRALFKDEWDKQYAALGYVWSDDAQSGEWLLHGVYHPGAALPGTIGLTLNGTETGETKVRADTSDDWWAAGVRKDARVRVSTTSGTFEAECGSVFFIISFHIPCT